MSPPIIWQNFRLITKPSPVPVENSDHRTSRRLTRRAVGDLANVVPSDAHAVSVGRIADHNAVASLECKPTLAPRSNRARLRRKRLAGLRIRRTLGMA